MSQYSKLGKNIALITIGNFASKILSFFLIPLYTAVLTTGEFGVADLMTTTINLISPFFTLLVSESIMRFALDKDKDKSEVLGVGLIIAFIGFLIMLLFSPLILLSKNLSQYYLLFVIYYFAVTFHSIISQFVKGIERVEVYSLVGVIQTICFITLNILLLIIVKIGVNGYLISLIGSHIIATLVLWLGAGLNSYIPQKLSINKELLREMIQYSIPLIPNSLSWWVSNSSDKYVLSFFCGLSVTGVYSVSQRIPSMFSVVSTIFISAWQISAIEDFGSERSRTFFGEVYRSYSSLNILIVSFLICFTRFLAKFLFSNDFYSGWIFVPILLFAYLFFAMAGFLGTIYTAAKKTKMVFTSTVVSAVSNIILNFILIPIYGGIGAAVATFISYFLVWIIRLLDSRKIYRIDLDLKKDVTGYLIIIIQVMLIMLDSSLCFVVSLLLLMAICILYRSTIVQMISTFIAEVRKWIKK